MAKVASVVHADDDVAAEIDQQIEASVLRTAEMFALTKRSAASAYDYAPSKKVRVRTKLNDTYLFEFPSALLEFKAVAEAVDSTPPPIAAATRIAPGPAPAAQADVVMGGHPLPSVPDVSTAIEDTTAAEKPSFVDQVAKEAEEELALKKRKLVASNVDREASSAVVEYKKQTATAAQFGSSVIVRRRATQVPKPKWHAPWKLKRVIAGHLGWVRSISVDPTNDWFVTGSADRTIKVWDLASGQLKLTLTGHINAIRGLEVSPRHPYLFSAGEDKKVLCWDLEYNKVIRSYHGHLSGVFSLKVHPTLDILVTGGRDAVARVWDMRTKNQIHVLSGHQGTVWAMETQATDPQIITGSSDSTVKLWDLAAGKVMTTLTNHKKAVRAVTKSPTDHTFMSGAADNMKKWEAKEGRFLRNFSTHNAIINSISINQDGVMASCGDNGSMRFWDYQTGYCFQSDSTKAQPGSLDSETGIYASAFDKTGLRFITCEADKTIKVWQEDSSASEESHPIDMAEWTKDFTAPKRY
ncbi:pre-mRNA-splicing factor prp46, putative [Phytophthora infestans T30-4]|uniref:Pre-mRNA-splicing factor prp46, putative n=1 Tax=Phytophthora infestans (strain T30-4) TaxID=403677 RepID=D0MTC7_PHYIT|nr:pre-mRNA-splicing factor prp46, putative [Phytophthora infestans T30-4]EEY61224.1 pre-mRNA-splicing factor prp46, putative [Phytophthora infestans T30-4]|eukprot:XP_002908141.1 pre-mRNA-splicing factor prp46, putative [Phytophthora infestans T30-4]